MLYVGYTERYKTLLFLSIFVLGNSRFGETLDTSDTAAEIYGGTGATSLAGTGEKNSCVSTIKSMNPWWFI